MRACKERIAQLTGEICDLGDYVDPKAAEDVAYKDFSVYTVRAKRALTYE